MWWCSVVVTAVVPSGPCLFCRSNWRSGNTNLLSRPIIGDWMSGLRGRSRATARRSVRFRKTEVFLLCGSGSFAVWRRSCAAGARKHRWCRFVSCGGRRHCRRPWIGLHALQDSVSEQRLLPVSSCAPLPLSMGVASPRKDRRVTPIVGSRARGPGPTSEGRSLLVVRDLRTTRSTGHRVRARWPAGSPASGVASRAGALGRVISVRWRLTVISRTDG